jgi:pimeloyl-ACP methyl ester carboxylesterase
MKTLQQLAEQFAELDAEISGNSVHYAEANPDASLPIIVVHGLTGTHYSMFQMAGVWAEQGKHVIAIDLPGHGASDEIEIRTFDDVADWLDRVISRLIPSGDFLLVGNSFGCGVVVAYTHKFGLRGKSRMILTAPIPSISPFYYRLERLTAGVNDRIARLFYYENRLLEPLRTSVLLGDSKNRMLRARVSESIRSEGHLVKHRYAFMHLMPANYTADPLSKKLPEDVAVRTMSFSGDADAIAPKSVHDHMKRIVGQKRVVEIANCGHLVHIEGVVRVTEALNL